MSKTEQMQEQAQSIESQTALVNISESQIEVIKRLHLDISECAAKGFNQQLKGAISSALTSARNKHSTAVQYGDAKEAEFVLGRIADLVTLQRLLN